MICIVLLAFFAQIAAIPPVESADSGDPPSGDPPGAQQAHDALNEQLDGLSLDQKSKSGDDSNDVKVESDPKSGQTRDVLNPSLPEAPDSPSSDPDVFVKIDAEKNGFLFFPSSSELSFADPVVDPRVTRELKLVPLEAEPMDLTQGEGLYKTGKFYELQDTGEEVVIKWFKDEILPLGEDWSSSKYVELRTTVETDFHTQSIAHMLSKLYSGRVQTTDKVLYVQPLLVQSLQEDGIHFGLMERRFETFHRDPPRVRQTARRYARFKSFFTSHDKLVQFLTNKGGISVGKTCL